MIDQNRMLLLSLGALMALSLIGLSEKAHSIEEITRMTKEDLRAKMSDRNIVIIDVRTEEQWRHSNLVIPGAVHENPEDVESWMDKYPRSKTLVFY
jgi:hypothetical protein